VVVGVCATDGGDGGSRRGCDCEGVDAGTGRRRHGRNKIGEVQPVELGAMTFFPTLIPPNDKTPT